MKSEKLFQLKSYRRIITALLIILLIFLFFDIVFRIDERYREKMAEQLAVITECGASPVRTTYVTAEAESDIVIRNGDTSQNRLSITCNVDWGEEVLPEMLEILKKYDIHITFFVTGKWAEKNPSLLRSMYICGHEIQSHGYSHKLCSQVPVDEVRTEIDQTEKIIENIIGIKPDIFAPPSGDFDDDTVRLCEEKGYLLSLWSADTIDWREGSTAEVIYKRIMSKRLPGAVILMHPKAETVKALPFLLEEFKKQNLCAVTLSELLGRNVTG